MSKYLQAIKYLNDTCINFLDRTKELYCTVTFTRKRAEILRDNIAEVEKALNRLEAIDNAEPSEALECLDYIENKVKDLEYVAKQNDNEYLLSKYIPSEKFNTIKQALLKAQEPKQYLKWEDLEFKEESQTMKVLLNGVVYNICFYEFSVVEQNEVNIYTKGIHIVTLNSYYKEDIQFFNDLHLERVEE